MDRCFLQQFLSDISIHLGILGWNAYVLIWGSHNSGNTMAAGPSSVGLHQPSHCHTTSVSNKCKENFFTLISLLLFYMHSIYFY